MLVVGELINTSRKEIGPLVATRDREAIQRIARRQVDNGAGMVDVNAGTMVEKETEALRWLVETVQEAVAVPLCIDSVNPAAIEAALVAHRGKALLNSISMESSSLENLLPLVKKYGCAVVGLCMDDGGLPETSDDRLRIARELVQRLEEAGVARDDIYLDPLIRPISIGTEHGKIALDTIRGVKDTMPGVHVICGLSNISFGLPHRKLLNHALLLMAMAAGLDAVILNPLDRAIMAYLRAGRTLLGEDPYCGEYIAASRQGRFD